MTFMCSLLALLIFVIFVVTFIISKFRRQRQDGEPPVVSNESSLLWGNAKQFSGDAVKFLQDAQRTHGDVFTIRLINQHLTVIMDPHSYEMFCKSKSLDFDPIQKQVNLNVFGFVLREPRTMIKHTSKTVSGINIVSAMKSFADNLNSACDRLVRQMNGSGDTKRQTDGLRLFVADTMFDAIFTTIFGQSRSDKFNSKTIYSSFETFHRYFNYLWLGLPRFLFPSGARAAKNLLTMPDSEEMLQRDGLSKYMKTAIEFMLKSEQSEFDIKGHNLVYLHVNYNTFRLAFWILVHLLMKRNSYEALLREISNTIDTKYDAATNTASFTVTDIAGMKLLDSVVQETCRLSSGVFVVRYIKEDTWFTTSKGDSFLLRKGDRAAMYPPTMHKDPEVFEDPHTFKFDRFVNAKFYKSDKCLKSPVIAFGYLCPGKQFALLQLKWYILTLFTRFNLSLSNPDDRVEYDYQYHGHEVLPPVKDVSVDIVLKETWPILQFTDRSIQ